MSLLFRFLTSCVLLLILGLAIAQDRFTVDKTRQSLLKQYKEADRFFYEAEKIDDEGKQELWNQKALDGFKSILQAIDKLENDSLAFNCYLKIGILEHSFGNFSEANKNYNQAIGYKNIASLKDSVFFAPLLY